MVVPDSAGEAAAALREGGPLRIRGGATKLGWGRPVEAKGELSTRGLDAIVKHNEGDFTAVLQAGVKLAAAQERFAAAGQMLALDPPGEDATIGGVIASGDSGPLRHRYGAPRDLVLGVQVALSDGSVARAGSQVIKNVAGYDLAKLMSGAFGTLGVICEVTVRLHPLAEPTATIAGHGTDTAALARAASELAHLPIEADCLDVSWAGEYGAVLVRLSGPAALRRAEAVAETMRGLGLEPDTAADEWPIYQRGPAVLRVSGAQTQLAGILATARARGARVSARAALGLAWLTLPEGTDAAAIDAIRSELAPSPCVLLDAPAELRGRLDPWGGIDVGTAGLMRRVKARFDPAAACNPGLF